MEIADAGARPIASISIAFGGDVTLGYHYEEYFDDQLAKGRTREQMLAYPFQEVRSVLKGADLAVVNLEQLERFDSDSVVDEAALRRDGVVKGMWDGVKILGNGNLTKKLVVKATKFSARALEAIRAAGGTAEEIPLVLHKAEAAAKAHSGKGLKTPAKA